MSFLKQLHQKLPITLSNEEFKDFQELFDNTESLESLGTKENQGIFKRVENRYGLEDWKTLKYTLNGEEVTMPEGVLKFKEWIEDPKNQRTFDKESKESLVFNPALNGNTLKSFIGDTYKGLDCKYMIPITIHSEERSKSRGDGTGGTIITYYYVYVIGVIYLGEGKSYGKIAFFTLNDIDEKDVWNGLKIKDYWKIINWAQPSFNTSPDELISKYNSIINKTIDLFAKIANKVKGLFSSKEKESE